MRYDADPYLGLHSFACWNGVLGNGPEWLTMQTGMITGIPYGRYVVFEGLKHSIARGSVMQCQNEWEMAGQSPLG